MHSHTLSTFSSITTPLTIPPSLPTSLLLSSTITYVFFNSLLPLTAPLLSFKGASCASLGLWLLGNVLFNYYKCVVTDPGTPPLLEVGLLLSPGWKLEAGGWGLGAGGWGTKRLGLTGRVRS